MDTGTVEPEQRQPAQHQPVAKRRWSDSGAGKWFDGHIKKSFETFGRQLAMFVEVFKVLIEDIVKNELRERAQRDAERGITSVGPHRDDIIFLLDGLELRRFGSQGQHRLFALSLKLAELHFFSDMLDDLPIFLLDDVFGDLDQRKTEVLMQMLTDHPGQVCITAANTTLLETLIDWSNTENRLIHIESGNITLVKDTNERVRV